MVELAGCVICATRRTRGSRASASWAAAAASLSSTPGSRRRFLRCSRARQRGGAFEGLPVCSAKKAEACLMSSPQRNAFRNISPPFGTLLALQRCAHMQGVPNKNSHSKMIPYLRKMSGSKTGKHCVYNSELLTLEEKQEAPPWIKWTDRFSHVELNGTTRTDTKVMIRFIRRVLYARNR